MSEKQPRKAPAERAAQTLETLYKTQMVGVLSTYDGAGPYANIVAFAATDDLREILFASPKATRKVSNLKQCPRAAFLVDNRTNSVDDFHAAAACTSTGAIREIADHEKEDMHRIYLARHPHLEEFIQSPSCAFMALSVSRHVLVMNFQQVTEFHVPL